jgi:hypothetical protein
MTRDEVKKRMIKIEGRPLHQRAGPMQANRRGLNYIKTEEEYEAEDFDSFFDFEEDLAGMEAARKQVEKLEYEKMMAIEAGQVAPEEQEEIKEEAFEIEEEIEEDAGSFFVMEEEGFFTLDEVEEVEEVEEQTPEPPVIIETPPEVSEPDESKKDGYTEVSGFEFKYCAFIKKDGIQCRRQAPKKSEYCSTHRKYIEKHGL